MIEGWTGSDPTHPTAAGLESLVWNRSSGVSPMRDQYSSNAATHASTFERVPRGKQDGYWTYVKPVDEASSPNTCMYAYNLSYANNHTDASDASREAHAPSSVDVTEGSESYGH